MSEEPVLVSYDLGRPVTLATDASEKAIGAVLTQDGKPVIFVSRILTSAEQRYSSIEREALAVVWAVYRLRQLLLGRTLFVEDRSQTSGKDLWWTESTKSGLK